MSNLTVQLTGEDLKEYIQFRFNQERKEFEND